MFIIIDKKDVGQLGSYVISKSARCDKLALNVFGKAEKNLNIEHEELTHEEYLKRVTSNEWTGEPESDRLEDNT